MIKTMIYQRKEWKILKRPENNNGAYLIGRTAIRNGVQHYSEAEIPENEVVEKLILKAKT